MTRPWLILAAILLILPASTFSAEVPPAEPVGDSFFNRVFRVFRSERYDPTDPTQLNTYATGSLTLNHLRTPQGRGFTYGLNLEAAYVLEVMDNYALGFDLPLLYSDIPGKRRRFGVGDLTINNSFIPYRTQDPDAFWNAGGILCSITVPSGAFDAGLGAGNWQLAPALVLSFNMGPVRAIPTMGYQFGFAGSGQSGLDRAPLSEGPSIDLVVTGPVPDPWYMALTPHYFYDRLAPADAHNFSLTLQAGRLIGKRLNQAIQLEITRELLQSFGIQTSASLSYTYYH